MQFEFRNGNGNNDGHGDEQAGPSRSRDPFDEPRLLRGENLYLIGRNLGIILGAGAMAALYQLMIEEARGLVHALRVRRRIRSLCHQRVLVHVLGNGISLQVQQRLYQSRDAFREGLAILADVKTAPEDRERLRAVLQNALANPNETA